jgi:hypothetical protein
MYITNHPHFNQTIRNTFTHWPFFRQCEINLKPCHLSDMIFYYNNLYGNCFKMFANASTNHEKSSNAEKIYREGDGFGIELVTGYPDNIPLDFYARSYFYQPIHNGISVSIFDHDNILLKPNIKEVLIKPGTYTKIKVYFTLFHKNFYQKRFKFFIII